MVSDAVELQKTKYPEDNGEKCDNISIASSNDSRVRCDGTVMLDNVHDKSPCFQNIEVTNSSDVHFGNKTYYQGPVTIKQVLYTNPTQNNEHSEQPLPIVNTCGMDNSGFMPDDRNEIVKNASVNNSNCNNHSWTEKTKGKKWLQGRTTKQFIIGISILILIMVSIVTLTIALLTGYLPDRKTEIFNEEIDSNKPNNDPEDPDVNITTLPKWIDRKTWLAIPPRPGVVKLKTPVPYVVIHHTATEECTVLADCKAQMLSIQKFHMLSNNWSDIGYNFVIGGDGYIYEARGWTNQGAHVKNYNSVSIGIAFIGLFDNHLPPKKSLLASQELIKEGVNNNYIKKDYKLFGMKQLSTFKSPGQKLYELIKTWPHWSATL